VNLEELRKEIESIDDQMRDLFLKRMDISKKIGQYKKEHGLPILDLKREEELIKKYTMRLNEKSLVHSYEQFLIHLMKLSKDIQK